MRNRLLERFKKPSRWLASAFMSAAFLLVGGSLQAQLSGVYTINSSLPASGTNYTSFSAAATDLATNGVSGAVTFNVAAGSYTDILYLPAITGASATNTITFDGGDSATTTLAYDATAGTQNAVILLDGADHVSIKNMKITHSGTDDAWGIRLANRAEHNMIDGVQIEMAVVSAFADIVGVLGNGSSTASSTSGDAFNDLSILSTTIKDGYYALRFEGSGGAPSSDSTLVVNGCKFLDNIGYGAYLDDIHQVTVTNTEISGAGLTSKDGFYCFDLVEYSFTGNTFTVPDWGLYISDGNFDAAPSVTSLIANNMIISETDEPIYFDDFESTDIVYNSFYAGNTSFAYGAYFNDLANVSIQNNIFYSPADYAFYSLDDLASATGVTVNYNIYYTGGSGSLIYNSSSGIHADLAAWQTASPSLNANSLAGDPIFVNAGVDLHLAGSLANGAALPLASITTDIDGDSRDATTPDIGADEYSPASCLPASGFTLIMAYADSARVAWTSTNGAGTTYDLEYGAAGFTPGTGTTVNALTDTFYTITGLTPQSAYDFYVTANCGTNGTASQAGPGSFNTTCAIFTAPYLESFTGISTGHLAEYSNCWTNPSSATPRWEAEDATGSNENSLNTGPFFDATTPTASGGMYMYLETSSGSTGASSELVSPFIDFSSLTTPELTFYYHMYGSQINKLIVYAEDMMGNRLALDSIVGQQQTAGSDPFALYSIDLSGLASTTQRFIFEAYRGSGFEGDISIDEVGVDNAPACSMPLNLSAFNITGTSVDFSWDDNGASSGYQVIYGLSGFDPASGGTMLASTNDTITISGLMPATAYDLYVYADCGAGDISDTAGPVVATTACPASFTAPYSTDFENITLGHQASYENCWTNASSSTPRWEAEDAPGINENSTGTGPLYDNTFPSTAGGHYMFFETSSGTTGDTNSIISPAIDISTLTVAQMEYYVHMFGATMGTLRVYAQDIAGNRTLVDSLSGSQQASQGDAWLKRSIVLSTLAPGTYKFVFNAERGTSFTGDVSIDDFSVAQAPTCFPASALGVTNVNTTSVDAYWTPGNSSNWIVEYGPTGFTPGTGTIINATNDTITISGLMAATQYDFYVTDSCGVGDVATTTGPETFYTSVCAPSAKCTYSLDLTDTWGDGWNGNEITIWQGGVPVGTYGANFTSGTSFPTISVDLCDATPTLITLSTQGGFVGEIGYTLTNPLNDEQASLPSGSSISGGDTLSNFTTDCSSCGPIVAPFYEAFDGSSTPLCFTQSAGAGGPWLFSTNVNAVTCSSLPDNSGTGGNYAWMDQSGTDDSVSLELPVIDVSGLTTPYMEFYYAMCGSGYSPVNITILEYWDGSMWNVFDTIDIATNGWQKFEDTIPAAITYNSGLFRMRFRAESGGSSLDFYGDNAIDDIRIYEAPSCFTPSNLGATNITSSSADIFWTTGGASNWIVEYGLAGFTPGTGTTLLATNDTITLSGLMAATGYEFYVQDSCGAGDLSLQTGPFLFNTACPASFAAPYSTDFEGISLGNNLSYENCWTKGATSSMGWIADIGGTPSSATGPNVDNTSGTSTGTYFFLETSSGSTGDTNVLYSPAIDITTLTTPMLSFYYHMHGATMGQLTVVAEDAIGTRTPLDSLVGQQQTAQSDPWAEKQILLSSLTPGTYRFLFVGERGSSFTGDMAIDDFSVVEAPSCFASSNLSVVSVEDQSATLTWTPGTGTSFDIEYGPVGFAPGTGTIINTINDTVTITGLTASTAYDFYVTDSCGTNGLSTTAGPVSFTTTACAASDQCVFRIEMTDAFGDGWNGGLVTFWQNGAAVGTLGAGFTTGSAFTDSIALCGGLNTVVTLSNAGGWPSEIGLYAIQPNGDTAGFHLASGSVGTGDTLFTFLADCDPCGTYAAPFFESFELNSPTLTCWSIETVSDSTLVWSIGTGSTGGAISTAYAGSNNAVYISQGPSGAADTTRLVSPVIDLTALVSPQVSFWYAQEQWFGDQNITNLYYRTSETSPWVFLWGDATSKASWTNVIQSLPNPSSTYQLAFEGINNWGHANVVDSLSITDAALVCSMADSVSASNITTTSADISWVSGSNTTSSWIEYGPAGFSPGSGTVVNPATSAQTLSGLMPGTLYEACVYEICSALGDTSMAACVSFATLCAPISAYPYLEDFNLGVIPACYATSGTSSSYNWGINSGGTPSTATGPSAGNGGSGFYMFVESSSPAAPGDSAFLFLPEFDLSSLSVPEIVYSYHLFGADIETLYLQAYDATSMTWTSIDSIVGQQQTANNDSWLDQRVDLSAYTSATALELRFYIVRGASFNGDAAIDDIIVRETPACVDPANLMATNVTSSSVSLSWDSDTNIVASTVQYGPVGFSLGSGTNFASGAGSATVTGLMSGTCYDFYVQDSCSSTTNWVGPITVCTIATCSVSTVPSSTTNDSTDCDGGSVTLTGTSSTNNDLVWLANGLVRNTGSTYVTDSIPFTTTFDVAEFVTTNPVLTVGPQTNIAAAGFGNFTNGQWITVDDTIHIDSMTVRHSGDVTAFVQVWDAAITNIIQRGDTFTTPAGLGNARVVVNMVLTPGVYFMNVDFLSGTGSLFRATGGATYPYTLPGLMSIDSTNFSDQGRIYYTFEMSVSKACIGAGIPSTAVVPGAFAGDDDTVTVCSSDAMVNLAGFLPNSDGGGTWLDLDATGALTDSIFDATQVMAGSAYNFRYIVAGVNGCAGDTANLNVNVEAAPDAGADSTALACAGSGIVVLRNYLTASNNFGGTWVDLDQSGALGASGTFNTNNATAGVYRAAYVLSGTVCDADTAIITVDVDDPVSAGVAVSDTVCDDEAMVDLNTFLDASATTGGMWSDLSGSGALSGSTFDATAVTNGTSYDFQYKVESNCGADSITVTLYVDDCDVSLREVSTGFIKIYPNPTQGLIKIDDDNLKGQITVEIYSANGQLMLNNAYSALEEIRLDISNYATGIYTIKVNSSKGLDVKRIIKQ